MYVLAICSSMSHAQLTATFDENWGVTEVRLNGNVVMTGATTEMAGYSYSLNKDTGYATPRDWNWPTGKSGCYFGPAVGELYTYRGHHAWSTNVIDTEQIYTGDPNHFITRHTFATTVITYDHVIDGNNLIITATVDNAGKDYYFQLNEWMYLNCKFASTPTFNMTMTEFYPSPDAYSPVTAASDNTWGVGVNVIEHNSNPVLIRFWNDSSSAYRKNMMLWMKNSPSPPGGSMSYKVVLRFDETPGVWQNLLAPYKTWFNDFYGPVRYSVDFRIHVMSTCAALELQTPSNPYGFRDGMDVSGWSPFLGNRLSHLNTKNVGPVIFWAVTGISPRGANYRPDFNVFPEVINNDWNTLTTFMQNLGDKRFGLFARPNEIAYQRQTPTAQNPESDATVPFSPRDYRHIQMCDGRFNDLIDRGAVAFYLDTYGSAIGCYPGSAEGQVFYLKHLRQLVGQDVILIPEFGFDAIHVFAPIWTKNSDNMGHKPLGGFSRWLISGASEICRVFAEDPNYPYDALDGAERAWLGGAVPLAGDSLITNAMMSLQNQYVNTDGTSKVRSDCIPYGQ